MTSTRRFKLYLQTAKFFPRWAEFLDKEKAEQAAAWAQTFVGAEIKVGGIKLGEVLAAEAENTGEGVALTFKWEKDMQLSTLL